jgi:hypothetical protein
MSRFVADLKRFKNTIDDTIYSDDADDADDADDEELLAFNTIYDVNFQYAGFQLFKAYAEKTGLNYSDALIYSQRCHCCDNSIHDAPLFGRLYCSERCKEAIEEHGHTCIRISENEDCLICNHFGRVYNDDSTPPDFVILLPNVCTLCKVRIRHPPFEYYEYDYNYQPTEEDLNDPNFDIHDIGNNLLVCHDCFCQKSTAKREFRDNFPINDLPCHHPVISTIHMFKELGLYNSLDDLQVWSDLGSFIGK